MILWLLEKNFEEGMNALFQGNMGMVKWPAHISREIASIASAMLIDNVIDTGATANAALKVLPMANVLCLCKRHGGWL